MRKVMFYVNSGVALIAMLVGLYQVFSSPVLTMPWAAQTIVTVAALNAVHLYDEQ